MDLNRQIAEKVMGVRLAFEGDGEGIEVGIPHIDALVDSVHFPENPIFPVYTVDTQRLYLKSNPYEWIDWDPLSDLNQCFGVVEKLNKKGLFLLLIQSDRNTG